jgi:glycosyltransferase involved in cell wall biosynthesis
MKVAIVVPTRGDRPEFLSHCKRMIHRQTYCPDEVIFVDHEPVRRDVVDLTGRYRKGISIARQRGCDFIVFWEDDDWYDEKYLEWIITNWKNNNKPEVFGVSNTYYFNLKSMRGTRFDHPARSSMFCTSMAILDKNWSTLTWPPDTERFLDLWMWRQWKHLSKCAIPFHPMEDKLYTIGIKHGTGMTGGGGHNVDANFYTDPKYNKDWLKERIDPQSFEFYKNYEVRNHHSNV